MTKTYPFFLILPLIIQHRRKNTFFQMRKKSFFVSKYFSSGPMALKICGNKLQENSPFFSNNGFLAYYFFKILFQKQVGRFISRQHGSCTSDPSLQRFSRSGQHGWRNFKVGKGAQVENLPFFSLVFLRKRRRWAVFKKHASGLGSTNLQNLSV